MQYPTHQLFSRQQLQAITGVPDDVLGYWLKEGLLVAEHADDRKHRRFRYQQLHVAMVLNGLRSLGANVTVLRAFAAKMQRGVKLAVETGFTRGQLYAAVQLSAGVEKFRAGQVVELINPEWLNAKDHERDQFDHRYKATSEADIIADNDSLYGEYDPQPANQFALSLSPFDRDSTEMYFELVAQDYIEDRLEGYNWVWVAWIDANGEAKIATGEDANTPISRLLPTAAFYISISKLVRGLWIDNASFAGELPA